MGIDTAPFTAASPRNDLGESPTLRDVLQTVKRHAQNLPGAAHELAWTEQDAGLRVARLGDGRAAYVRYVDRGDGVCDMTEFSVSRTSPYAGRRTPSDIGAESTHLDLLCGRDFAVFARTHGFSTVVATVAASEVERYRRLGMFLVHNRIIDSWSVSPRAPWQFRYVIRAPRERDSQSTLPPPLE